MTYSWLSNNVFVIDPLIDFFLFYTSVDFVGINKGLPGTSYNFRSGKGLKLNFKRTPQINILIEETENKKS